MKPLLTLCSLPVLVPLVLGCSGNAGAEVVASSADGQEGAKETQRDAAVTAQLADKDKAVVALRAFIEEQDVDKNVPQWKTQLNLPPKVEFDATHAYFWNFQTNKGPIKIRLMPQVAPIHVASTIYLTELGFYDGLTFHRVIPGFMAQGGCPLGTGTGNPGYGYDGEFDKQVRHDRPGLLSMANTGRPGSDGSQFFLTFVPTPHLNDKHTIFGEVVDGMDTVRALEAQGTGKGTTKERLLIEKASITVEPAPEKDALPKKEAPSAG